jgi:hypothetical protein
MNEMQAMAIMATNLLAAALVPLVLLVAALKDAGGRTR